MPSVGGSSDDIVLVLLLGRKLLWRSSVHLPLCRSSQSRRSSGGPEGRRGVSTCAPAASLTSLHCQHSKVVSTAGMFCTVLHLGQRTESMPTGAGGGSAGN